MNLHLGRCVGSATSWVGPPVKRGEMPWNEVGAPITQGLDNLLTLAQNMGHTWTWDQKFVESEIIQAYGLD
jgi:hypothetical protein